MERWNVQHCVTCVRSYYKRKSVTKVHSVFRRQFVVGRHGRILSRNTILAWVKKFGKTGSVLNVKHGAPLTVRTPENVQRVREAFERSPQCSRRLGVNRKSLFLMIKEIKFHPYKLQVVQQFNNRYEES
jgi:hypothetical protein